MDILSDIYNKGVAENESNLRFWSDYLQNLESLDFKTYSEQLKVPVLVPIGSRILFRGELKHTNEVTVALGADYFVKCSLRQADILRQHRIKGVREKVDAYNKEKEYLQNKMSFTKQNVFDNQGEEIIEYHTEDEDKVWRENHRQNVKEYMQNRGKDHEKKKDDITDEELWERLEELELQEELENELNGVDNDISLSSIRERRNEPFDTEVDNLKIKDTNANVNYANKDEVKAEKEMKNKKVNFKETRAPEQTSKLDLLQQVIDRQNELDEKLQELKNKERSQSKTEKDLMSRLDELEQLDELEDEMDRLDHIIETEDIILSEEEESSKSETSKLQRRVSFVDEDDSETLNLTFKHSEVEPNNEPYDPEKGIQKPSDIYKAHSKLFEIGTTSILKKSKYVIDDDVPDTITKTPTPKVVKEARIPVDQPVLDTDDNFAPQTIVIKDVIEKVGQAEDSILQTEAKPMSLFKKKRMQNKS